MSKIQAARLDFWRQLIAKQQQSGMSVRVFCQQHRTSEHSFYHWRKRLAERLPMKFARVETNRAAPNEACGKCKDFFAILEVGVLLFDQPFYKKGCQEKKLPRELEAAKSFGIQPLYRCSRCLEA